MKKQLFGTQIEKDRKKYKKIRIFFRNSGDVPGGSRARIIDFSMVLGGFGRGHPRAPHPRGWIVRPPKTQFQKKTPNTHTHGNWQMVLGLG